MAAVTTSPKMDDSWLQKVRAWAEKYQINITPQQEYDLALEMIRQGQPPALRQDSSGGALGFFAIGCSDEGETLWLCKFSGGTNGTWETDPQQALVFIHKRQADDVMTIPGIAAYHPFCQFIATPQESRSGVLYTKADVEAACEVVLAGFRSKPMLDKMVDRFLAWPLPASVCSDACVVQRGYPHRIGTNLLTADEARQMLEHVLCDDRISRSEVRDGRFEAFARAVTQMVTAGPFDLRDSPKSLTSQVKRLCDELGLAARAEPGAPFGHHHYQSSFLEKINAAEQDKSNTGGMRVTYHASPASAASEVAAPQEPDRQGVIPQGLSRAREGLIPSPVTAAAPDGQGETIMDEICAAHARGLAEGLEDAAKVCEGLLSPLSAVGFSLAQKIRSLKIWSEDTGPASAASDPAATQEKEPRRTGKAAASDETPVTAAAPDVKGIGPDPEEDHFNCGVEGKPCQRWCGANACLVEHAKPRLGVPPPQWVTSWPNWHGIDGNVTVVPLEDYQQLRRDCVALQSGSVEWERGMEEAAKVCESMFPERTDLLTNVIAAAIRSKIKPAKGE